MEKITLNQLRKQIQERNGKETLSELSKELIAQLGEKKCRILMDFICIDLNIATEAHNFYFLKTQSKNN